MLFFIDDENPHVSLEGQFAHVAVSYKGQWLHSYPKKVNGRLSNLRGVHLEPTLLHIGFDFIVFENPHFPDPSEDFYKSVKDMHFNLLAPWNSNTETHCSLLVGKHLGVKPTKMEFKARFWKHHNVRHLRGKLGLSPKEIFDHVQAHPDYRLHYKSPFSTYKPRSSKKVRGRKCGTLL